MFRVWLEDQKRWLENVPVDEALTYKSEGFVVIRMDLPYPPTGPYGG